MVFCIITLIMSSVIFQMLISSFVSVKWAACLYNNASDRGPSSTIAQMRLPWWAIHGVSLNICRCEYIWIEMKKSRSEYRKKLTLHADFVLSSARVRDEIHLHRHLPHRSVGWLTWTHTKTATGELERGIMNIRENRWEVERKPRREMERSGNRNKREGED